MRRLLVLLLIMLVVRAQQVVHVLCATAAASIQISPHHAAISHGGRPSHDTTTTAQCATASLLLPSLPSELATAADGERTGEQESVRHSGSWSVVASGPWSGRRTSIAGRQYSDLVVAAVTVMRDGIGVIARAAVTSGAVGVKL
jgi:hypothetical protein